MYNTKMNKVAVIGSRTFDDYGYMKETLDTLMPIDLIVSGGAKGADSMAEQYAAENGIPTLVFKPDWKKHGKIAGFLRNTTIVEESNTVVAFWDGKSNGTKNSLDTAKRLNKTVIIKLFGPNACKPLDNI
jgi:hypothetical protein